MKKHDHLYLGKAGHLTVMSEFLIRGWNVAIPEVDIGDDIFVVQDTHGILRRVQVKSASSIIRKNGYGAFFRINLRQLFNLSQIPVHFVFIVRDHYKWTRPLIIRQDYLLDFVINQNLGTRYKEHLNLYLSYKEGKVLSSGFDLSDFVADYVDFPLLK